MTLRQLPRRAFALASSALVGVFGVAVLPASPVSAQPSAVESSCAWDPETEQWLVTWTVAADPPVGASAFRLVSVEATPGALAGIGASPEGEFPHRAGAPLAGVQRLPEDATAASLAVRAEWDDLTQQDYRGEIEVAADCGPPQPSNQWRLDCDALTITIHNPTGEPVTLTFAPNTGSPVPVEVAAGGSATVEFPPSEGLAIDVLLDGRSIVDPADPIEITSADLAAVECDERDDGGGGGLPTTGTSSLIVGLVALVLLGLGTGLYLLARRHRIRFTA